MPKTFTHFHPLGYVLVVMLGAGVAERVGLFGTAMRAGVKDVPNVLLHRRLCSWVWWGTLLPMPRMSY